MSAENRTPLVVVRILFALLLIILAGSWGFFVLFSDSGATPAWAAYVMGGHAVASFLVGVLLPLRWTLALGTAWGAVAFGLAGVIAALSPNQTEPSSTVPIINQIATTLFALVVIPAVIVISGHAGSRVMTNRDRRHSSSTNS